MVCCGLLSLCLSGGRACISFLPASRPRLQSHLCPSVSFDLTLAHSAWKKLHNCLSQGIALSPFWTPNRSIDIVQTRLPTSVCLPTIVNHQFRHVSHGELTLNFPSVNTRDGFGVDWDFFWRLDSNVWSERCSQMLHGRDSRIQSVKPHHKGRRRCRVLQIVTTSLRLRILLRTSAFASSVLNAFPSPGSVAKFPYSFSFWTGSHQLKYSFGLTDLSSSSPIDARWDPSFQSHTSGSEALSHFLGRSQAVFLAAGHFVTWLFLADLQPVPPSRLHRLIFVGVKRAWRISWDVTGGCGSNSLYSCLHASNPPLGTCWTTCSAFSLQVRTSTQCACAENRSSALVIAVLSVMIGSSTLVSTCCSVQAAARLNFPKSASATPLGSGHAVGSLTQIDITAVHRECSNLFRIDTSWPCFRRLLSDLSSLTSKVVPQPTLSLCLS